jgi:Zn-dependent protease
MMWVSLAGPSSNFFLAFLSAVLIKIIITINPSFSSLIMPAVNFQFPSMAGFDITMILVIIIFCMICLGMTLNLILAVFNLIPLPPLDGGKIIQGILPRELSFAFEKIEPYGFLIIVMLAFSGILWKVTSPFFGFSMNVLLGVIF